MALDKVSFDVPEGGVCGLIGPNGAGKTTLFNCLSRLYTAYESGDILFDGQSIAGVPVHNMAAMGIGRTFQNLAMFRSLSVRKNIMVGGHCRSGARFAADALWLPSVGNEEKRLMAKADRLIDMMELGNVADRPVGDLPFGLQKRVELARAMAADPRLLLLDEPAAG
ncbi:MAG: ATP-binding cassette domain-containing protein [Burkholderiaceae bacterium]